MATDEQKRRDKLEENRTWWLNRIAEDEENAKKIADDYSERLRQMYESQYKKTVVKLNALMSRVQEGKGLSRTQLWNYAQWIDLERSLSQFVKGGSMIECERVTACLDSVFEQTIGVQRDTLNRKTFSVAVDPRTVIDSAWSGERYSTRIWKNRTALAQRIRTDMEDMLVQGRGLREMRMMLQEEFGVGYRQADTLLRTEMSYVFNQAHRARYKSAGVKKLQWVAKNEEIKRCAVCRSGNNTVYPAGTTRVLPAHPRCGCRWVPVIELQGEDIPADGEEVFAERMRAEEEAEAKAREERKRKRRKSGD